MAKMSSAYLGQIKLVSFLFAPQGWAFCSGQLLPIQQYQALFSLLGTSYGGDGEQTFALPDLRSRVPIHSGQGIGLSPYSVGAHGGEESHTLLIGEMPLHSHPLYARSDAATTDVPTGSYLAQPPTGFGNVYTPSQPRAAMASDAITTQGGNASHTNLQPILALNFIIALQGIFPSQG